MPYFQLFLKDDKLYKKGFLGWLSFVNYAYNKKYYKDKNRYNIIVLG